MASLVRSVCKSRMTGDCHVRFCERLGVKFPLPTRRKTPEGKSLAKFKTISNFTYYCHVIIWQELNFVKITGSYLSC